MSAINCVFALHDGSGSYYKNTYITLLSLLENTSSSVVAHIIHDESIVHGKKDLEELCARYGQRIEFHQVPALLPEVVRSCSNFHFSALYRLYIHELISADKALYLDSDLIFQCDVAELWNTDLNGFVAAAAKDEGGHWRRGGRVKTSSLKIMKEAGFSQESYFNAGVMLLDLGKLRKINAASNIFIDICLQYAEKGIRMVHADQDILNIFCMSHGGYQLLDGRFNYLVYAKSRNYSAPESLKGKILHFGSAQTKPWAVLFPAQLAFWKYYAMSPWGGDVFEKMQQVFFEPRMSFMKNYVLNSGRRQFLNDYAESGLAGLISKRISRLFGGK